MQSEITLKGIFRAKLCFLLIKAELEAGIAQSV